MEPKNYRGVSINETFNLQACLELLITSSDINVKIKLISMISGYLLLNDSNIDKIVTYNPLYDQICHILVACSARKAAVTLNFVTALLYVREEDDERRRTLVVYARNIVRSSGCLAAMCEMFVSTMMNQDTWRALCRSIAEACRGVEANQSYCTHIVPVCIQRTNIRNIEMLTVLQSLLQNHNTNIELFIECDGMSLFRREFLQHDVCLQLLATCVETSKRAAQLVAPTHVCEQLRSFLNVYGPHSKLGQWATIILYHASKTTGGYVTNNKPTISATVTGTKDMSLVHENKVDTDNISANTTKFFQNVMKEVFQFRSYNQIQAKTPALTKNVNDSLLNISDSIQRNSAHNKSTSIIFAQRLNSCVKRASTINLTKMRNFKMKVQQNHGQNKVSENLSVYKTARQAIRECPRRKKPLTHRRFSELSFTFLQNKDFSENLSQTLSDQAASTNASMKSFENNTRENHTDALDFTNFKPKFISTPKHRDRKSNNFTETMKTSPEMRCTKNSTALDQTEVNKTVQESKQQSIGGRFFEAINESCTTLVKTVRNIFSSKNRLRDVQRQTRKPIKNSTQLINASSCSYSFTEYMRKRDVFLRQDHTRKSSDDCDFSVENSCNTCNDTIKLKRKLVDDQYLKRTVRKLKLGINLYGCDFKRISRTMWPKDSYMTPPVLYNLYRKLLLK